MRTLEDRLNQASSEAQQLFTQAEVRPVSAIRRRHQQRRAFIGIAAFALVLSVFGGTALLAGSTTESPFASDDSPSPDSTAIDANTTTTLTPDEDPSRSPDTPITEEPSTSVTDEWDIGRFGENAHFSVQILTDSPGEAPGTAYKRALESVTATGESLGDVDLDGGWTARAFTFTSPTYDMEGNPAEESGYYFIWQHSATAALEVAVYVDLLEEATIVVSSIEKFAADSWPEIINTLEAAG